MKTTILILAALFSTAAFSATDFNCQSLKNGKAIEVNYINGDLSYTNNGRTLDVSVNDESVLGKTLTVTGFSKGLVFAGGGTQTVAVNVNLKSKKGTLTITTKTFYRRSEVTHKLSCSL